MATTENEKKGIFDFLAGALAVGIGDVAAKAVSGHIQTVSAEKAKELFVDAGDRAKTMVAVAKLVTAGMTAEQKKAAGEKARGFIVEAWTKHNEEGELTGLLKKIENDDDRSAVLCMLGMCGGYDEFAATIRAFLFHDNALQMALKAIKNAEADGKTIISEDVHTVATAAARGLNNAAGAVLPSLQRFSDWLENRRR